MQLSKTTAPLDRLDEPDPFIAVLTDPTTGGVLPASRASAT